MKANDKMMKYRLPLLTVILLLTGSCQKDDEHLIRIEPPVPARTFLVPSLSWSLASTPASFPESGISNNPAYGFNRAKICWYNIDPVLQTENALLPAHISKTDMSDDYVRTILETEVFPLRNIPSGQPTPLSTLNIHYYPDLPGPYNFDAEGSSWSAGINDSARLNDPASRWGGITTALKYIDHDINYIDFWMMDPFINNENITGKLYINIGSISEDILRDGLHQNEASISYVPEDNDSCTWGLFGLTNIWAYDFFNVQFQDFGFDGLNDSQERLFYADFLSKAAQICSPQAYESILKDPCKDNYHYFLGSDYDEALTPIIERYAGYNGMEGNSTPEYPMPETYPTRRNTLPDKEDTDNNAYIRTWDAYYEYSIEFNKNDFVTGNNFIDTVYMGYARTIDGYNHTTNWYHFKIPVQAYTSVVGNSPAPADLKNIRLYISGFNMPVIIRMLEFYITE